MVDVEKLDLVVETDHEKAKYVVTGNKELENGSVVKVKVTAEDKKTTKYKILNRMYRKMSFKTNYIVTISEYSKNPVPKEIKSFEDSNIL